MGQERTAEEEEVGEREEFDLGEPSDEPGDPYDALASTPKLWYAVPVWRLIAFAMLGGAPYQIYWAYRSWEAYRASWGYSREPFWRAVYDRTGYRPSALWRGLMASAYCFCLFPAVQREARAEGVQGVGAPVALACLYGLGNATVTFGFGPWTPLQALALVPIQLSMNALSDNESGSAVRASVTVGELLCVALGAGVTLTQLNGYLP